MQQIGLGGHGTVIDGLTDADQALLDRLEGGITTTTLNRYSETSRTRAHQLVDLLGEARLLVRRRRRRPEHPTALGRFAADAAVWGLTHPSCEDGWDILTVRNTRTVLVQGDGRTAAAVRTCLAATGVRLSEESARSGCSAPDLAVLVDHAAADPVIADRFLAADVPHLSVVVRETDVLVGPLVRPGHGPCVRCLDLHRSVRDPQWPLVLAQLVRTGPRTPPPEEGALATLTAGFVTLQALTFLDGFRTPASVGATLEIELPDGLVCRRPWPAHPSCGCHWPPPGVPSLGHPQWPDE